MEHLDVCTTFLQGDLEEAIFIDTPEGFKIPDGRVLTLNRPIYGLNVEFEIERYSKESWFKAVKE